MKKIILLMAACLAGRSYGANSATPPNVIYILADDAGYGDFGCYGQKTLLTPNVDRMANEGKIGRAHV